MHSLTCWPPGEDWCDRNQWESANTNHRLTPFFETIPPERVGLNGEYDHSGLAKRVELAFRRKFESSYLSQLSITQRGSVVILTGQVLNRTVLSQLVEVALNEMGAKYVETYAVSFKEGLHSELDRATAYLV